MTAKKKTDKKADRGQFIESPVRFRREELETFAPTMLQMMRVFPAVRTVEDSPRELGVLVKQQDIDDAIPGNPAACAVSLGAQRNCPGHVTGALISRTIAILIYRETQAVRFIVPKMTYANLFAFDRGGKFEPGIYLLGKVPPGKQLIKIQGHVMASRAMRGRIKAKSGEKRPKAKMIRKRSKPQSLFLRTWGNASIQSTLDRPTVIGGSAS